MAMAESLPKLSLRDYVAYFIPGLTAIVLAALARPELVGWAEGHVFAAFLAVLCLPYMIGLLSSALF